MNKFLFITQLVHKLAIAALLIASAVIPFMVEINLVTAFVFLPLLLIITFTVSLAVEYQISIIETELTYSEKSKKTTNNTSRCLIKR